MAGALAISAGVMIYVSFAEIFCVKAVEGFLDAGYDDSAAWRYATVRAADAHAGAECNMPATL